MTDDLLPRLQALLARWDNQAATAARKLQNSLSLHMGHLPIIS